MRERAESIGGQLMIDSTPGSGTTVRFELPLANAVHEQ
jgi:signal transduction histidine kinase